MRKLVPFRLAVSLHTKLALALALTLTLVVGGFGYLLDSRDRDTARPNSMRDRRGSRPW